MSLDIALVAAFNNILSQLRKILLDAREFCGILSGQLERESGDDPKAQRNDGSNHRGNEHDEQGKSLPAIRQGRASEAPMNPAGSLFGPQANERRLPITNFNRRTKDHGYEIEINWQTYRRRS
jgi:hypothetical protein